MDVTHECRICGAPLEDVVVDLGMSPPSESFLAPGQLDGMEPFYPLVVEVCRVCFLVQIPAHVDPRDIFDDYAYFSSYSDAWLRHAESYVDMITERLSLGPESLVVEVASNDGYLLQYFDKWGVPCFGVEPARTVAEAARARGIRTVQSFFGRDLAASLAAEGVVADLIIGNNVLAQVPDLDDFVGGFPLVLAPSGTVTLEFPHVLRLLEEGQFDTIYHEHYSYFSLTACRTLFDQHGLEVYDVEELWTHGGSLRLYLHHAGDTVHAVSPRVGELLDREREAGLTDVSTYRSFGERVAEVKRDLLSFLIEARRAGKTVAAYGAPGKSTTLLNYCGIRTDLVEYAVDRNPYKHGRFTPGTRIPIFDPSRLAETRPDIILILPWNLREEILAQLAYAREWGATFVIPIPRLEVVP